MFFGDTVYMLRSNAQSVDESPCREYMPCFPGYLMYEVFRQLK